MSSSFTLTETKTFTVTHARHMAAKVATDLKRIQRLYEKPCDVDITKYEIEVIELLKKGYLKTVTYGFRRDGDWIEPTLSFNAHDLAGSHANDDDPGRIRPGANIKGASFYSYLTYNSSWHELPEDEKSDFKKTLPFQRGNALEPGINGYMTDDKIYSSGGRALYRSSVRSY